MVRRKLDFLKHSIKLAPSVSRRTSSSVSTIAAIRFSTSSTEYPRDFRAFAALASFPLLRSHQGDLEIVSLFWSTFLFQARQNLLWHERPSGQANCQNPILRYEYRPVCPVRGFGAFSLLYERDQKRPKCERDRSGATEDPSKSCRCDLPRALAPTQYPCWNNSLHRRRWTKLQWSHQ